jgi:cold shock CspA family protein
MGGFKAAGKTQTAGSVQRPSTSQMTKSPPGGRTGTVKSYNGRKGFGFINCPQAGGDIFFGRDVLPEDAREVSGKFIEGRSVQVEWEVGSDSRPRATQVTVLAGEGEEIAGMIKSYNETTGYGFLTSTSLPQDARFNRDDMPQMPMGAQVKGELVRFQVSYMPDGKIRANNIFFQTKKIAEKVGISAMQMGMPFGGWGGGWGSPMFGGMGAMAEGIVKMFNEERGFGFINMPGIPADIFFGKGDLKGGSVTQGSMVSFQLAAGDQGKLQAKAVSISRGGGGAFGKMMGFGGGGGKRPNYDSSGEPPAKKWKQEVVLSATGQCVTGSIKSFNLQKGFGFITSPEVTDDIFFMKTNLPQGATNQDIVGSAVGCEIMATNDGRLQADSINFL